jgi:hypothetical protein
MKDEAGTHDHMKEGLSPRGETKGGEAGEMWWVHTSTIEGHKSKSTISLSPAETSGTTREH